MPSPHGHVNYTGIYRVCACMSCLFPSLLQADYRRAVSEIDQKEFLTLRLTCCEMRNSYVRTTVCMVSLTHTHAHTHSLARIHIA